MDKYLVASIMPNYASVTMHYTPNIILPLTSVSNINSVSLYTVLNDNRNWIFKLKHHLFLVRDSNPYTPHGGDVALANPTIALTSTRR